MRAKHRKRHRDKIYTTKTGETNAYERKTHEHTSKQRQAGRDGNLQLKSLSP